jgi:L-lysine 2,3-aminomutase
LAAATGFALEYLDSYRFVEMNSTSIAARRSSGPRPAAAHAEGPLSRWQQAMRSAVRDPVELCRLLRLPAVVETAAVRAAQQFPVFAPLGYVARMRPGDLHDPLLRQVLPLAEEDCEAAGFSADPLQEFAVRSATERAPGMLQKYAGRALLVTTGACAIHCRYCFRRSYPYDELPRGLSEWQAALEAIAEDQSIEEVILSGGDPLTLTDQRLAALAKRLAAIPHVRRLRVHTRLPIVIPERVCDELLAWLSVGQSGGPRVGDSLLESRQLAERAAHTQVAHNTERVAHHARRLTPIVVVHANHPAELDGAVEASLARLAGAGVMLLNQSVLLRGVNDDADVLAHLSERLIDCRVTPYYLHQLDRVQGAAHFEVPVSRGVEIIAALRRRLPGYAVPRYVRETPGHLYKDVLA